MDKDLIYPFVITALIVSATLYLYSIDKKPTIKMILPWITFLIILGICMISKGADVMDTVIPISIAILIPLPIWTAYVKGKFNGLPKIASQSYHLLAKLADAVFNLTAGLFLLGIGLLILYLLIAFSWELFGILGVIFAIFWLWGMLRA